CRETRCRNLISAFAWKMTLARTSTPSHLHYFRPRLLQWPTETAVKNVMKKLIDFDVNAELEPSAVRATVGICVRVNWFLGLKSSTFIKNDDVRIAR
ncbi:MAG: hypothetical protein WCC54_14975, partial [Pseudolabrys sp.]